MKKVDSMRISVTDLCNLRCVYCMPSDGLPGKRTHGEILSYEEILRVCESALSLGITRFRVTGGEPMVRRGVLGFLRSLGELQGVRYLALTTNGTLLAPLAGEIASCGVDSLNVSLDTVDPDTYARVTRGGRLRDVLDGIEAARMSGFRQIKLNVVVMKGVNDGEAVNVARFARERNVTLRFIEFMPLTAFSLWGRERFVPLREVEDALRSRWDLIPDDAPPEGMGPASYLKSRDGRLRVGFIAPISHGFCSSCNRLRLTSDGCLRPCLAREEEIEVKGALRGGQGEASLRLLIEDAIRAKPCLPAIHPLRRRQMAAIGG